MKTTTPTIAATRNLLALLLLFLSTTAFQLIAQTEDEAKLVEAMIALNQKGDAQSQYELGMSFYRATNFIEAVKWFRKAAEQNQVDAQIKLGECYYAGHGVENNEVEGHKWLRKADEQNSARAKYRLGRVYLLGKDELGNPVDKDEAKAIKYYGSSTFVMGKRICFDVGRL
jgi:TPR repeat protein